MNKGYPGLGQPYNELLGAGAIYANYGETNEFRIGLAKGENRFTDNAVFRDRSGNGDFGLVKGAIDLVSMRPELTTPQLRIDAESIKDFYAGVAAQTASGGTQKLYRTNDLTNSYLTNIAFVGMTRGGDNIVIVIQDAIGLNPLEWVGRKDEETIANVTLTGVFDPATFDPDDDTTWPYYVEVEAGAVTFTVTDAAEAAVESATITLSDGQTATTDASGQATFTCTFGKVDYSIAKASFTTGTGTVTVDSATEAVAVTLAAA